MTTRFLREVPNTFSIILINVSSIIVIRKEKKDDFIFKSGSLTLPVFYKVRLSPRTM